MYFKIPCPHCSKSLKIREEQTGKKCRCPYCKSGFTIPAQALVDISSDRTDAQPPVDRSKNGRVERRSRTEQPPQIQHQSSDLDDFDFAGENETDGNATESPPSTTSKRLEAASDGANVSLIESGVIGLLCAVIMFAALHWMTWYDIRVGNMFWNSAGINFPTTLLMFWSFAILYLKSRQLTKQKSALLLDLLPSEISEQITVPSLDAFLDNIETLPTATRESFLVNRVIRGIEHFRVRRSAAETVTMMESQSAIDAARVAGSYSVVKVFIWAMPILGFIGTVMGVSSAVAGLSSTLENAADVSAVTSSMKGVFGGLGTAFDTTLIALIMSMLVKIPASVMQKNEDALITIVDEYCNENLLRRLQGSGEKRLNGSADGSVFREAVEAAMGTQHAEMENWFRKLDGIGIRLTDQVVAGWSQINSEIQEQQAKQLSAFHQQYLDHTTQLQQQLQEMSNAAHSIQQTLAELGGQTVSLQSNVTDSVSGSTQALQTHIAGLERGLTGLNGVLETLGEQQVVVQQVEPAKRGWFGRK